MANLKRSLWLAFRMLLLFFVTLISYAVSGMLMSGEGGNFTPAEEAQAGQALLIISLIYSSLFAYLLIRSQWRGWRLAGAIFIIYFGVETFITQIETLYFNDAVNMSSAMLRDVILSGALRALIFAPLAVLIFNKWRTSAEAPLTNSAPEGFWKSIGILAAVYVAVYLLFGYWVAWQSEAVRVYYTGSSDIQPFFTHMANLFFFQDTLLIPFQFIRGILWAFLALLVVWMIPGKRWEIALVVGITFAILISLPLGLFPNPYMPVLVREAHFYELVSSMLLYGFISGWMLFVRKNNLVKPSRESVPAEI